MSRSRNIEALRAASEAKKTAKYSAAKSAIASLRKAETPISFVAVARAAGVSTSYLYSNPELKATIERLRTSTLANRPDPPATGSETGVTAVLLAKLKTEQATTKELRLRIRELEARVETLLGRIMSQ
jgi:thiazole synthase ThiGH ThiG subunit